MTREGLGMGEGFGVEKISGQAAIAIGQDKKVYSLRLLVVPVEAVGTANVKPAADIELLKFEADPQGMLNGLEVIGRAIQATIKSHMEEMR